MRVQVWLSSGILILAALATPLRGNFGSLGNPGSFGISSAQPRLRLDVVVIDENGAPVTDIRPSELEVWISGYRVPVTDVFAITPASHPRTVLLLLDDAAVPATLAPRVREAAKAFVELRRPGDRLFVARLLRGRIEDAGERAELASVIDRYSPQGFPFRLDDIGQHVLTTVAALAAGFPEASDVRHAIVGIGAGWLFDTPMPPPGVRDLEAEWRAAMRAMAASHTSLYVIDPGGIEVRRPGGYAGSSGFARETGGHAFLNTNDLAAAAARIWAEAGTYYMLAMEDPPVQRTAELREVEVRVLRKGVTARARKGIKGKP
jgi:VWFA-related protein